MEQEITMKEIKPYDPAAWTVRVPNFRDERRCWKFMRKYGFRRLPPKVELVFLKNITLAVKYAVRIDSRLPAVFEKEIKNNPKDAFEYIEKVITEPFPEFEESLAKDPILLVQYSKSILQSRLPVHLEEKLIGDPYVCFEYAWQILDGRLPESLHNYMYGAVLDDRFVSQFRSGSASQMNETVFDADYRGPKEYFEFIKWQRKNLARQIKHYSEMYSVEDSRSVSDLLFELENGR